MKHDTSQMEAKLTLFAGPDVETIAKDTGLVQRRSPMNGLGFLQTIVLGYLENPEASLNDLAQVSADLQIEISAQGLDQRITERAEIFMQLMFIRALEQFRFGESLPIGLVKQFNGIHLTDSSVVALPDTMAKDFPGCGGNGPQASLKVQLSFEFQDNYLSQVVLRAGRDSDKGFQEYVQVMQEGSLSITDLGYFSLNVFKEIIDERHAYVLSRLDTHQVGLLHLDGRECKLLDLVQQCGHQAFEMDVLVGKGSEHQLPFRLLVFPVPQEIADQRRRKAKEDAKRRGKSLSQRHLTLLSWSFFITNTSADQLPMEAVMVVYRMRWQVELLFKLCKSYCGLDRVAGFRRARILVELYGKLIVVVLTHFVLAPLRMSLGLLSKREISPVKVRETIRRFARDLNRALGHPDQVQRVLSQLLTSIGRFGFKQKRTKKPNICHLLALVSAACGFEAQAEAA
jgi:hypothetical protein